MPERFISEALVPVVIEPAGMAAGTPGLPRRFTWDGRTHEIAQVLAQWRETKAEGGRKGPAAELYAHRHWWHAVTTDGLELKFYCERQTRSKQRWWVYCVKE
jgi:Domain of unknown function (DUF6504)